MNEPIDLCIALNGPLVDVLLPVCYQCLINYERLDNVAIHFVSKDCTEAVHDYCRARGNLHFMPDPKTNMVADVAATCQWMIDHCGDKEWCFIMHFDVFFKTPWLTYMRSKIAHDVGQIGCHGHGMVGYRRSAINICQTTLDCVTNIYGVHDRDGHVRPRHQYDPRCTDTSLRLWGWDVGELLELVMWNRAFRVLVDSIDAVEKMRSHPGCGSGRCLEHNAGIRARALNEIKRMGLKPIA